MRSSAAAWDTACSAAALAGGAVGKEPRMGSSDSSPVRAGRRLGLRVKGEGGLGAAREAVALPVADGITTI